MGEHWTHDRERTLRALLQDSLSASQIADELGGVTRNAVIGKCKRMGLKLSGQRGGRVSRPPNVELNRRSIGSMMQKIRRHTAGEPAPPSRIGTEPTELPADQSPCAIPFTKATDETCKWPLGEAAADMPVCGAATSCKPYCGRHHRIAYTGRPGR